MMTASGDRTTWGNLGSGICLTDANLSDDLFLFYNRISNRNTFLSVGLAMGFTLARTYSLVGGNAPRELEDSSMSSSISMLAGVFVGIAAAVPVSAKAQQSDSRAMTWMENIPPRLIIYLCSSWEKAVVSPMLRFICFPLPQAG
jgi:hypothetical protein